MGLPSVPTWQACTGADRARKRESHSNVQKGLCWLNCPYQDAVPPKGKWGRLKLCFSRSYSNTLPTQSARQSCFQLPHSALRRPGMPVLSAEQWHVTGRTEETRDQSREWAKLLWAPDAMLLRPASTLLARCQGLPGCHRPFRLAQGRGLQVYRGGAP